MPVELEAASRDQRDIVSIGPGAEVSKQGEGVPIAPLSHNGGRPQARPYFDGGKDPNGRLRFATEQSADFVGLEFADRDPGDHLLAESATRGRSFLQPTIHGVPSDLLDSSDRRFVDTLDAESGNLIEHGSAMLESVIDRAAVSAESPATTRATESSAFSPVGLVESIANNYGGRGLG